jgi:hypothetical protein
VHRQVAQSSVHARVSPATRVEACDALTVSRIRILTPTGELPHASHTYSVGAERLHNHHGGLQARLVETRGDSDGVGDKRRVDGKRRALAEVVELFRAHGAGAVDAAGRIVRPLPVEAVAAHIRGDELHVRRQRIRRIESDRALRAHERGVERAHNAQTNVPRRC